MQQFWFSVVLLSLSATASAATGYIGNEQCDSLSVKGKKKQAALCYKKEAQENMEIIDELRASYDPASGIVRNGYTAREIKELRTTLEKNMAAIKASCKDDECVASETRHVIHYFNQVALAKNAQLYGGQNRAE